MRPEGERTFLIMFRVISRYCFLAWLLTLPATLAGVGRFAWIPWWLSGMALLATALALATGLWLIDREASRVTVTACLSAIILVWLAMSERSTEPLGSSNAVMPR